MYHALPPSFYDLQEGNITSDGPKSDGYDGPDKSAKSLASLFFSFG